MLFAVRSRCLLPLAALSLVMPASGGYAQTTQGSVIGTVKDQAGAVVPGAPVTLISIDTGVVRSATSNGAGEYRFEDVPAGHYTVEIAMPGFDKFDERNVALAARQQLRVDPTLAVGSVQQEVQVSGESASAIETDTPSISAVYSQQDAQNLPVNTRASANGTSALNIVGTLPGVETDHSGNFSLQGALPFQTEVSVDGVSVQSATSNAPIGDALPSTESISELRADGALNNAEFGQPGEITITTKGGTNTLHGGVFWYAQNAAFDAIPYTYPTTTVKPKLVANTFGASVGGPVVFPHYDGHNRTFFWGAYEGWRHPSSVTEGYVVPSTLMKQGNFSKYTSAGFTGLRNPFTGGSYGTTLPSINAAAQKLLQFYPDPNVGDPTAYTDNGVDNYLVNKDSSGSSDQFDIRVDQYFGSNQKFLLWGRFTWKNFPINSPEPLAVPSATNANKSRVLKVDANYTFTPHLINEAGFGFTLYSTGVTNGFDGTTFTEGLGLQGLQNLFYNGLPELDFNHLSSLTADRLNSVTKSNTYVGTDNLSWLVGRHSMRFGAAITGLEAITPLGFFGADNYGTFRFNTSNSAGLFTGVDFADFLSGLPYQTDYDVVKQDNDGSSKYYEFYAQDQWQFNDSLTFSYGVRYEFHPGYSDAGGDIGNFDPSRAGSGAVIYPDGASSLLATNFLLSANACTPFGSTTGGTVNGVPCMPVLSNSQAGYPSYLKKVPHLRFMPRLGFAWRPFGNDRTAIRGGFGMYDITLLGGNFYSLTGTLQAQTSTYTNTLNTTTHAIGYQWPAIYTGGGNGGGSATAYGTDYFGTANSTNWKDPYTEQWSLSVDRDLSRGYGLRVSYIGSESHQLVWAPDENTLPFSSTVSAANQPLSARLFPNWGRINTRATGANENYESAQVELNHRFQAGLQFNTSYTFAKALADNQGPNNGSFAGETGGARATSVLARYVDFGNVYGTRRNRWNTTAVYDLPVGRGRMFGHDMPRLLDAAIGGWRLSNIFLWESGPFESPYFPDGEGDPSGTGSGLDGTNTGFDAGHRPQHPDQVQGVSIKPAGRTRLNWINTAAFTCPGYPGWTPGTACTTGSGTGPVPNPIGRFGTAQVGSVVGPGIVNLSTGLSKTFSVTERVKLRLEGTFTNVLNHTNLGDPNMDISSPSFGLVSTSIGSAFSTENPDFAGARSGQVSARIDF